MKRTFHLQLGHLDRRLVLSGSFHQACNGRRQHHSSPFRFHCPFGRNQNGIFVQGKIHRLKKGEAGQVFLVLSGYRALNVAGILGLQLKYIGLGTRTYGLHFLNAFYEPQGLRFLIAGHFPCFLRHQNLQVGRRNLQNHVVLTRPVPHLAYRLFYLSASVLVVRLKTVEYIQGGHQTARATGQTCSAHRIRYRINDQTAVGEVAGIRVH